jgi:glycine betaine transporter
VNFIAVIGLSGILFPEKIYDGGIGTMTYLTDIWGWIYMGGSFQFVMFIPGFAFSKYVQFRIGA